MTSPDDKLKILDAHTASVLWLARIDGEEVCAELKKHFVENEVVLYSRGNYYFTNAGRLAEIADHGAKILSEFDGIKLGNEICTLPKPPFEVIMKEDARNDTLRSLVLAAFVVKSMPECEPLMGITEEDAVEMRAARFNELHYKKFGLLKKYLVSDESIIFRGEYTNEDKCVCNVFVTSRGRALCSVWNEDSKKQKVDAYKSKTITSTMALCRMPEALVRKLMCIKNPRTLIDSFVCSAEAIKAAEAISTTEAAKLSKRQSANGKRKHAD